MEYLENIGGSFLDQLHKAMGDEPADHARLVADKIKYVSDNIARVKEVNDKAVFHPVVSGEYIYYFLTPPAPFFTGDRLKQLLESPENRTHYYPIQYALILLNPA